MFSLTPAYSLCVLTTSSCVLRYVTLCATRVASSAYHLLDRFSLFEVNVYDFWSAFSHRMRCSTIRRKRSVDRGYPWRVPHGTGIFGVLPCGVSKVVCAPLSGLVTIKMKSSGTPRILRVRSSCK